MVAIRRSWPRGIVSSSLKRLRRTLGALTNTTRAPFLSQPIGLSVAVGRRGFREEIGEFALFGGRPGGGWRRGGRRGRRHVPRRLRVGSSGICHSFGHGTMGGRMHINQS